MTWNDLIRYLQSAGEDGKELLDQTVTFLDGEYFHHCDVALGVNNGIFLCVRKETEETE